MTKAAWDMFSGGRHRDNVACWPDYELRQEHYLTSLVHKISVPEAGKDLLFTCLSQLVVWLHLWFDTDCVPDCCQNLPAGVG